MPGREQLPSWERHAGSRLRNYVRDTYVWHRWHKHEVHRHRRNVHDVRLRFDKLHRCHELRCCGGTDVHLHV
jgi:hypothetical protein